MRRTALLGAVGLIGLVGLGVASCGSSSPSSSCTAGGGAICPTFTKEQLMDPLTCKACHEQHYDDWSASMHAYAADDPLFVAMNQRGQDQAQVGTFCVNCHAPMAVRTGKTVDGTNLASLPQSLRGVTCYYCHTVDGVLDAHQDASTPTDATPADAALTDAAVLDDDSLHFADDGVMRASFHDPLPNVAHNSAYSGLHDGTRLESAQLCGGCHDVVNAHGAEIERTYSEWTQTLYDDTNGGETCGQCHMHKSMGLAANVTGAFVRSVHDHKFPGVDLALVDVPGVDPAQVALQRGAVQDFLGTELAMALCVRGIPGTTLASILVVLDNVAAGHDWPSGAVQDRRAWVQVVASVAGAPIYESGVVPDGSDPTDSSDPDLWLLRDCMLDSQGSVVHTFWDAYRSDSNELPGAVTFDPLDPRFYQTHIVQTYPRTTSTTLSGYPDTVTVDVRLLAFPPDLFDDLFSTPAEIGFSAAQVAGMRARLVPLAVAPELTWTQAAANDTTNGGSTYFDKGIPVSCVATGGLNPGANKIPAPKHTSPACTP